jgi:hypothetical protein
MKRSLISLTAAVLGLVAATGASAKGNGHPNNYRPNAGGPVHVSKGSRNGPTSGPWNEHFVSKNGKNIQYYTEKHHPYWSYWYWDTHYGCRLYYDPFLYRYFYYCVPDSRYYPVSYSPYGRYSW